MKGEPGTYKGCPGGVYVKKLYDTTGISDRKKTRVTIIVAGRRRIAKAKDGEFRSLFASSVGLCARIT